MQKEATARLKINKLLTDAKWRFFESPAGSANISLENNVKLSQKDLDEYGNNFDKIQNGFIDFLLQDSKGFPLVILEAKSRYGFSLAYQDRLLTNIQHQTRSATYRRQ